MIEGLPKALQEDRQFLLQLTKKDQPSPRFAFNLVVKKNRSFQNDAELLIGIMNGLQCFYREVLNHANDEVKQNPQFGLALLKSKTLSMSELPPALLGNPEFMTQALEFFTTLPDDQPSFDP